VPSLAFPLTAAFYSIKTWACGEKRKEKTAPFGVNLMRSQVLYWAAQVGHVDLETVYVLTCCHATGCFETAIGAVSSSRPGLNLLTKCVMAASTSWHLFAFPAWWICSCMRLKAASSMWTLSLHTKSCTCSPFIDKTGPFCGLDQR